MYIPSLRIEIVPRLLHFKQPAGTSRGVYLTRRSWYVIITSPQYPQQIGIGECAPLPDLSCDAFPEQKYENLLRGFCKKLQQKQVIDHEALRNYPSMLFGLETAWLSWKASFQGDYLSLFNNPFTRGETGIPINGLVWMGSYEEMLQRMETKLKAGFRCIKIKIGAIHFEQEVELLRRLRERYPRQQVELRVDANGAFSPEEALQKLEILAQFDIHSIEQPIRAGQWEAMREICRQSPLPVALDEELIGINRPEDKRALLQTIRPQYIILKPSLHGGIHGAEEWIREAQTMNIPFWVTSALESNVGLNAIAQWYAEISTRGLISVHDASSPVKLSDTVRHQGLGTGQLFTDNFPETRLQIEGEQLWATSAEERRFKAELQQFRTEWESASEVIQVHTSGSTGTPKPLWVEKSRMTASATRTCRFLQIKNGDSALLCMPLQYIAGKMMAVRAFVCGLRLITVAPCARPLTRLYQSPHFVAMTPMQVYETLKNPRERHLLKQVKCLIIGGGSISNELQKELENFPNPVWSTYGMTETLSHIALRRLNGPDASEHYHPLEGVTLSLNEQGCLVIEAPDICPQPLATHDRAVLHADGGFTLLGRIDNVICSGGLKLQIEQLEHQLATLPVDFRITSLPDPKFGEAVTLLYTGELTPQTVATLCRKMLRGTECPKHIFRVDRLPQTETGKPARAALRALAVELSKAATQPEA